MRIKKGDNILVIAGKDRGRKGKVVRALPQEAKIVVEGINMRTKHLRAKRAGQKGQMVQMPSPFDVSNVKIVCEKCQKATRVGYKVEGNTKTSICKKCGAPI